MRKRLLCALLLLALPCAGLAEMDDIILYADQGGVRVFEQAGHAGLMDTDGNVLLPAEYDAIQPFRDSDYALVVKGEYAGVARRDGTLALDCEWDTYYSYVMSGTSYGRMARDDGYQYLIDLDTGEVLLEGNYLISKQEDLICATSYGYHDPFELEGPCETQVYDLDLNPIIKLSGCLEERTPTGWITGDGNYWSTWLYTLWDAEGQAKVCDAGRYSIEEDGSISYSYHCKNLFGEVLRALGKDKNSVMWILHNLLNVELEDGAAFAKQLMDDVWRCGILRTDGTRMEVSGHEMLPPRDDSGLYAVATSGDHWGYVNNEGQWAIAPVYADAEPFTEGTAAVQGEDGLWRLIEPDGTELPARWNSIVDVGLPLLVGVTDDGAWLMSRRGEVVSDEVYHARFSYWFEDSYPHFGRYWLLWDAEERLSIIDPNGQTLCRAEVTALDTRKRYTDSFDGTAIWAEFDGLWGVMSLEAGHEGEWRVEPQFDYYGSMGENLWYVIPHGQHNVYMDNDGNILGPTSKYD